MRFQAVLLIAALGCGKSDKAPDPAADKPAPTAPADKPATQETAPTEPVGIKACDLISEADATTALGQPTKYRSKDDSDSCVLDPVADNPPKGDEITFSAKADGGKMFDYVEKGPMKTGKKVEGVGDKALIEGNEDGMLQFALLKNGKTVHGAALQHGPKRPGFTDRLQALMKKMAEKM